MNTSYTYDHYTIIGSKECNIIWSGVYNIHGNSTQQTLNKLRFPVTKSLSITAKIVKDEKDDHPSEYGPKSFVKIHLTNNSLSPVSVTFKMEVHLMNKDSWTSLLALDETEEVIESKEIVEINSNSVSPKRIFIKNRFNILIKIKEYYERKEVDAIICSWVRMFYDEHFKDVTFKIGEESVMAHRCILASRSQVFNAMLKNETREKTSGIVELKDTSMKVFKLFLEFLYTNHIRDMDDCADGLLALADKYDIQCLKDQCEQCIGEKINRKNAIYCLIIAHLHNCELLKAQTLGVISCNSKKIVHSESFRQLRHYPSLYREVLSLIAIDLNKRGSVTKVKESSTRVLKPYEQLELSNDEMPLVLRILLCSLLMILLCVHSATCKISEFFGGWSFRPFHN